MVTLLRFLKSIKKHFTIYMLTDLSVVARKLLYQMLKSLVDVYDYNYSNSHSTNFTLEFQHPRSNA